MAGPNHVDQARTGYQPARGVWTIALNSILLFVILFYVYPLKYMAGSLGSQMGGSGDYKLASVDDLAALFIVYGLAFAALFLCFSTGFRGGCTLCWGPSAGLTRCGATDGGKIRGMSIRSWTPKGKRSDRCHLSALRCGESL